MATARPSESDWPKPGDQKPKVNELRAMRQLREENRKLKQVVADLTLDKQILQEAISRN